MSETTTRPPEDDGALPPEVLVLPAEFFFVERVEVPPALESGELDDFAELSMESNAPFPLEQLYWGYLVAPDQGAILIYAALRDRLRRAGFTELESYTWVLPDFATLEGARFAEPLRILLAGALYDTSVQHPGGEALPDHIASQPLSAEAAPTKLTADLHLRPLPVELTEKGLPIFAFETLGEAPSEGHWSPLTPDEASLWRADIRPAEFKTVERNNRRTSALAAKLTGYAILFACLLVLMEGLLFAGQVWLGTLESKVEAQTASVRRIEDKQSLMNKLDQVAQNELRPIAILEAANQIRVNLGNTGIEYDETVIEGSNRLTIEGKANTINELNAYTAALRSSGNFQLIGSPKSITRSGKTTFTVTLDYLHSEPPAAVLPETPETAEAEVATGENAETTDEEGGEE